MPTYKCHQCGNEIVLSLKPGQCDICGASKFRVIKKGNSKPSNNKIGQNPPSSSFPSTSALKSSTLNPSSGRIPKTNLSTGKKSSLPSQSKNSSVVPPATKHRKTYTQPSLPLYSSSSESPSPYQKSSPKSSASQKKNLRPLLMTILPIVLSVTGLSAYWLWQRQFDTSDFEKVVFKEVFNSSKNWSLTDGSIVKKGSLFQQQPTPNHYGASIWKGKIFTDVDFSADVTKIKGSDENPFGVIARVSGKSSENFYYLLMDSKGEFILGKHTKDGWFPKVGWQKSGAINTGNAKNNMRIVCKGDLIMGFINNERVGSFRDQYFTSGKVAVFSMRGKGEAVMVYFDNAIAKERTTQSSPQNTAHLSPQKTVQDYYATRVKSKGNDPFWDLVSKVDLYEMKTLKESTQSAKIKVWLKYQMKNGLTICESRVFTLAKDDQEWTIQGSEEVTQQPSCKV